MGLIQNIFNKIRGKESEEDTEEFIPDNETRDKYLRSLRREDRVLDEEEEKKYLIKKIRERRKEKLRKDLFGIKDKIEKRKEHNQSFLGKSNL